MNSFRGCVNVAHTYVQGNIIIVIHGTILYENRIE